MGAIMRGMGAPSRRGACRAALCHLPLLLSLVAAAVAHAASPPPSAATRRLLDRRHGKRDASGRVPYDAYDRAPMTGRAAGRRAGGEPDQVQGLANPDRPALSPKSASMEDLVLPFGYPLESYPVETPDGFILRLYRIPHGKKNATSAGGDKPVVLLHHGVTLASNSYVLLDPESSMGFYLADAGFDVWMVNTRGNTYSRGHRKYRHPDQSFWDFSMDELALIDLPSQIDFILKKTGRQSLALVGHSQGCTLPLMLLAAKPEYNDKIWLLTLMGPVVHAREIQAPYLRQQAKTMSSGMLNTAGIGQFIPNTVTSMMIGGCALPANSEFCFDFVNLQFYGPSKAISTDDYMRVGATWPSTVSVRNLYHWSQLYQKDRGLQMFDYGTNCELQSAGPGAFRESCNQARYGQPDPPAYDLSRVTARAALLEGAIDLMATKDDSKKLRKEWRANLVYEKMYKDTAHMDFVWARDPICKDDLINLHWANARFQR